MQSETIFGKNRGESAHSNNGGGGGGSQARVIDMPKVVKGIHAQVASEDTLVTGERSDKTQPNSEATQKVKLENVTKQSSEKIGGRQLTVERRKTFAGQQNQRKLQSSRVSSSILLDDFFSRSRERLQSAGGTFTPKNKNQLGQKKRLSETTATSGSQNALQQMD